MARIRYIQQHVPLERRRELFKAGRYNSLRKSLQVSQEAFWGAIDVPQVTGYRYESGGKIPLHVVQLVRLHWVEGIDFRKLERDDVNGLRQLEWDGE